MTVYNALLRAVYIGGTGRLPMTAPISMFKSAGHRRIETYAASGNLVFESSQSERAVKAGLETRLEAYAGQPVTVIVRTALEWAAVLTANPFPRSLANLIAGIFLHEKPPAHALERLLGQTAEKVRLGVREIYVSYGTGMAHSKLKIPGAAAGTARNINTVARLAGIAAGYG